MAPRSLLPARPHAGGRKIPWGPLGRQQSVGANHQPRRRRHAGIGFVNRSDVDGVGRPPKLHQPGGVARGKFALPDRNAPLAVKSHMHLRTGAAGATGQARERVGQMPFLTHQEGRGVLCKSVEIKRLDILRGRCGRFEHQRAAAVRPDQGQALERGERGDIHTKLGQALAHQQITPAFRKAVGEETVQPIERPGPSGEQTRFGRIIERRDGQPTRDDVLRPLELRKAGIHGEPGRRKRIARLTECQGDGQRRAGRQPHEVALRRGARCRGLGVAAAWRRSSSSRLAAAGAGKSPARPSSQRRATAALIKVSTRLGPWTSIRFHVLSPIPARFAASS